MIQSEIEPFFAFDGKLDLSQDEHIPAIDFLLALLVNAELKTLDPNSGEYFGADDVIAQQIIVEKGKRIRFWGPIWWLYCLRMNLRIFTLAFWMLPALKFIAIALAMPQNFALATSKIPPVNFSQTQSQAVLATPPDYYVNSSGIDPFYCEFEMREGKLFIPILKFGDVALRNLNRIWWYDVELDWVYEFERDGTTTPT